MNDCARYRALHPPVRIRAAERHCAVPARARAAQNGARLIRAAVRDRGSRRSNSGVGEGTDEYVSRAARPASAVALPRFSASATTSPKPLMPGLGSGAAGVGCCLSQRRVTDGRCGARGAGRFSALVGRTKLPAFLAQVSARRSRRGPTHAGAANHRSFSLLLHPQLAHGFRLDLANGFLERKAFAGDVRLAQGRRDAAQLLHKRIARALIERTPPFAGALFEPGDCARDQWIVVSHL